MHLRAFILFLLVPCVVGQSLRVVVYPENPIFYFDNGEPVGLGFDVLQGAVQVMQNTFGRTVTLNFIYTNSVETMLTILISQQAGYLFFLLIPFIMILDLILRIFKHCLSM